VGIADNGAASTALHQRRAAAFDGSGMRYASASFVHDVDASWAETLEGWRESREGRVTPRTREGEGKIKGNGTLRVREACLHKV
jgi:hypothetical protein